MYNKLLDVVNKGVPEHMLGELVEDAQCASDAGVVGDEDYNVYFFIGHLSDDILNDTFGLKLEPNEKKELKHYMLSNRGDDYKLDNLTDYRLLIHKWLCDRLSKKAYPNIAGREDRLPSFDIDRWITTLKSIYASINSEEKGRKEAIDHFTQDWDSDERRSFLNWMRYYEEGTTEKYNVKTAKFIKEAFGTPVVPEAWANREDRASDKMYLSTHPKPELTKREQELERAKGYKRKMKSRLRAFKTLLEKYNDILPKQKLDDIYDELYRLEKNVIKLDVYASLQDCVVRSANRLEKFGFKEGADFLHKVAAEPAAGEEVMQSLPPAGSKNPDLPTSPQLVNVQSVISRLEAISKSLKSRDMIRELASIDILLNEMGMASYFPELTDAQAKMIESFGYSSNKIEGIIAKLRGTGASSITPQMPEPAMPEPKMPVVPEVPGVPAEPSPTQAPKAEPIETGELLTKPVGKVEKKLPTE